MKCEFKDCPRPATMGRRVDGVEVKVCGRHHEWLEGPSLGILWGVLDPDETTVMHAVCHDCAESGELPHEVVHTDKRRVGAFVHRHFVKERHSVSSKDLVIA